MRRKNGSKRSRHLTSATSRGVKPCFSPALSRQSPLRRASSSSSAPALLTPLQGRPHNTHWIGDPYRPRCQLTGKRANEALNMSSEGGGVEGRSAPVLVVLSGKAKLSSASSACKHGSCASNPQICTECVCSFYAHKRVASHVGNARFLEPDWVLPYGRL